MPDSRICATARSTQRAIALAILIAMLLVTVRSEAATVVVQQGDASIAHDAAAGTWTLAAGGASLILALDPSRDFSVVSLRSATGTAWNAAAASDSTVHVGGRTLVFGSRPAGFAYQAADPVSRGATLQLNATFRLAADSLTVTRHYAIVSGSPTFEVWTTYSGAGASLADLNAWQMTVPSGTLHWLTGLDGDAADVPTDAAFTLQQQALALNQPFALGASHRASEHTVPWFSIDGSRDEFYGALMWSGAWSAVFDRTTSGTAITVGLGTMSTTLTATVDGPHMLFGVVPGGVAEGTAALRSYVLDGLRGGRPLSPLVTYNTWFAYGTEVDEASMRAEMDRVAALGVELFVIDAGWYSGAGAAGPFDFDAGLGGWTADPARFPNGLAPLRDYAHSLGLQFGVWVEPERVNLSVVGAPGVEESWLATEGGQYGSDYAGQICLASAAARQWLLDRLTTFVNEVQPDYLKWDNNLSVNCDRDGHGHGADDGNFAHTNALYDVLSQLRASYPNLMIENVSGGGNRLDIGMLRFTDVAWMDDRTAPSVHVRHNLQGLSVLFPPAYLLSFVTDDDTEPLHDAPDLSLYFRSRMGGALGLCFRGDSFTEGENAGMEHEVEIYKAARMTITTSAAALLTGQAAPDNGPPWDVLQESTAEQDHIVINAVQSDTGVQTINVKPAGLQPATTYQVQSVDTGILGTATGAALMSSGIDILQSPNSAAHLLIITARE
ncbi:MAG: alpha-galactosidase [Vicinamibacterales bacterium]